MNPATRATVLGKFRHQPAMMRQAKPKILVVYDVMVKSSDVPLIPLIINYGALPYFPRHSLC